jgi:hypothetical protein
VLPVWLVVAAALVAWASSAGTGAGGDAAALGPRPLPPTFVGLELGAFPRPAAQACADNTHLVRARPPNGLARALAAARPGTTVLLAPGVYRGAAGDSNALTVSTPNVCLRTPHGRAVLVPRNRAQRYGALVSANDTVIDGLVLRGFTASVSLSRPGGRTLRRVTLQRVAVQRPRGDFRDGIVAYDDHRHTAGRPPAVDGLLLLNVTVRGADLGVACNAGPCAHWWIERTRVTARRRSEDSGADAFAIEDGRQIAVVDSTFRGAAADGLDTKATGVVVFGARVLGVARNAIKLWHGGDVIDSVVDGSGADASLAGAGPGRYRYLHLLVTHHLRRGANGYVGTWGYDDRRPGLRLEILNSVFYGNARGGFFAPASARLSIRHTIFGDRSAKLIDFSGGRSLQVSQLPALQRSGQGRANLSVNPRLAGRRRAWAPLPGSAAIDTAERVPGLTRDLLGGPRVRGAGPDIGPVER